MKKLTLSIFTAALVVASAPAFADQPTGSEIAKTNSGADTAGTINNLVGRYSSQVIQNGQAIGGNHGSTIDNTTSAGSRSDLVQGLLHPDKVMPH